MSTSLVPVSDFPGSLEIVRGKGSFVWDAKGKKYLDLIGGWCVATVGWAHPAMAKAIAAQGKRGLYVPPLFHERMQENLAKRLVAKAPKGLSRVIRCTSGSEAVEFAIKCARAATGKPIIVSIDEVWHGHTYGAASLGNVCVPKMHPALPGFLKLPLPRTPALAEQVVQKFEKLCRTRKDIAAFMSEPVWTNAGCFVPPADFYPRIEAICRRYGVLLVMDEVATGIGRTGKWFASEHWGITPDILCVGKSFTGGYATMAATLVTERVAKKIRGLPLYSTFGWLGQDAAAVAENLSIIEREKLVTNARKIGALFLKELEPLRSLRRVKDVRGFGMVFGIEFRLPIADIIRRRGFKLGILTAVADANILFFSPPLSLSAGEAKEGARLVRQACGGK